jgi:hypothetical protein
VEKKRRRGGQRKPAATRKRNNLTFRTRDDLRGQLEKASAATGRSISEEVEYRLNRSFTYDDAFGSQEMRHIAVLMAASFLSAGNLSSSKPIAEWIKDPDVFRRAMFGTVYALLGAIPNVTDEDIALEIDALKSRLLTNIANRRVA